MGIQGSRVCTRVVVSMAIALHGLHHTIRGDVHVRTILLFVPDASYRLPAIYFLIPQGMQDFVKEPVQGLVNSMDNNAPDQLMVGMARGAGSLLRHSVGGVANSASLITGACFDVSVCVWRCLLYETGRRIIFSVCRKGSGNCQHA